MKKLKWNLTRKQYILLGINGLLVLLFFVLTFAAYKDRDRLYSQQGAERWAGKEEAYAQVSAFFAPERNVQADEVKGIRSSLLQKLSEDSLYDRESDNKVLVDAYSGECDTQVRKDSNTLSVTVVGVGNDFFQIHPIPLLSGSYISGDDLNQDRVILDENLAWALFGSNDIVGMQVWIGDNIYVVAGVVAVDDNALYKTAYGTTNRMYVSYETLKAQQEDLKITCYEAVMPNSISNYAYYALKSACGQDETEDEDTLKDGESTPLNFDSCEIIENTNRFEPLVLLEGISKVKYKSMRTNSVEYPFWENIARVVEDRQLRLLIIRYVLLIFPIICVIVLLYRLWKSRTWTVKGLVLMLFDRINEYQARRAEEKRQLALLEEENQGEMSEDLEDLEESENFSEDIDLEEDDNVEEFFQSEDWDEQS
jgi:hypothetical protein